MNKKFLQSLAVGALALSLLASCSHLHHFGKCRTCKKDEAAATSTTKEMKTEKKSKKSKKAKTEATEMKTEEKKN